MIVSSSAMRSGGMTSEIWRAHSLLGRVAEQALGGRVPALDDSIERFADDRIVGRLHDSGEKARIDQAAGRGTLSRFRCLDTSRKISTHPAISPRSSLIGAALSSIGRSTPSLPMSSAWFEMPTTALSRSALAAGFSSASRLRASTMRKTESRGWPMRGVERPSGHRLGDRIQIGHATVDVGGDDGIADAGERHPHQLAALARPAPGGAHGLADRDDQRAGERCRRRTRR